MQIYPSFMAPPRLANSRNVSSNDSQQVSFQKGLKTLPPIVKTNRLNKSVKKAEQYIIGALSERDSKDTKLTLNIYRNLGTIIKK